jgi:hypothetical protein
MQLPARDVKYLEEKEFEWEILPDPNGSLYLLIKRFDVSAGGFSPSSTTLLVRIPQQYPLTPLDMWYCHPPIRIASTGQFAPASDVIESHLGESWQRFSRHLNGTWRPGVDCLRTFFTHIHRELQGNGRQECTTK